MTPVFAGRTHGEWPTGTPVAVYRSHAKIAREMALASLFAFLVVGVGIAVGVEGGDSINLGLLLVLAIGLFVAGVGGLAHAFVFRARLNIYGNGVLVERLWAKTFTRWEEIEALFEFAPPKDTGGLGGEVDNYQFGFSRVDGKTFRFHVSRINDLRGFAAHLHQKVDDLVRTRTLRALAAGEVVWFGYIGIGRDGLHSRKGVLPWSEVASAGCVRGTDFEVLKKGSNWAWFSKKISVVENVAVFTELIKSRREWSATQPTDGGLRVPL